jgi:hypothetical protein
MPPAGLWSIKYQAGFGLVLTVDPTFTAEPLLVLRPLSAYEVQEYSACASGITWGISGGQGQ